MEPNSLYRWESSPGLEHSCWSCHLKANNPKARQQCYGVHSVPCFKYHNTLFAIGKPHDCYACIIAHETHETRHKEIAGLVNEIKAIDRANELEGTPCRKKNRHCDKDIFEEVPTPSEDSEHIDGSEDDDEQSVAESASHFSDVSTTIPLTKAEIRTQKKQRKLEMSIEKAAKNQQRHNLTITQNDIDTIAKALHGEPEVTSGHPLATDKTIEEVIERNRHFVAHINEHNTYLLNTVARQRRANANRRLKRKKHDEDNDLGLNHDESEAIIDAVLLSLHITSSLNTSTPVRVKGEAFSTPPPARRAGLVQKLRVAVKNDLAIHENEQKQTCIRAGGFWRYVGRPVFERMTELAKQWDWRTGTKIVEEEIEAEDVVEDVQD